MITRETEPLHVEGRLFTGRLTIDRVGLIVNIELVVDGILIKKEDALARDAALITDGMEFRMREIIKQRYRDKLHPDLFNEL